MPSTTVKILSAPSSLSSNSAGICRLLDAALAWPSLFVMGPLPGKAEDLLCSAEKSPFSKLPLEKLTFSSSALYSQLSSLQKLPLERIKGHVYNLHNRCVSYVSFLSSPQRCHQKSTTIQFISQQKQICLLNFFPLFLKRNRERKALRPTKPQGSLCNDTEGELVELLKGWACLLLEGEHPL